VVTTVLSDVEKRLYARQVLLREVGMAGQARLCATEACIPAIVDAAAGAVAAEYLLRAGVRVTDSGLPLTAATSAGVEALAGEPMLRECAAWLAGAWAAVETIKGSTGAGEAAALEHFVLNSEVS
jgi:hypothetical protein